MSVRPEGIEDILARRATAPRVAYDRAGPYLRLDDGRDYPIPADPIEALGLVAHLAAKTWATRQFLRDVIEAIARVRDWKIHR